MKLGDVRNSEVGGRRLANHGGAVATLRFGRKRYRVHDFPTEPSACRSNSRNEKQMKCEAERKYIVEEDLASEALMTSSPMECVKIQHFSFLLALH